MTSGDVVDKMMDIFDLKQRMRTLAANLAVAGALWESFYLGVHRGATNVAIGSDAESWRPNTEGRVAHAIPARPRVEGE